MKITKEDLMEIIKEEMAELDNTDTDLKSADSVTATDAAKNMRSNAKEISKQAGVTIQERGIIKQFVAMLTKYAEVSNIKSGNIFSILNKLNDNMAKQIKDKSNNEPEQ